MTIATVRRLAADILNVGENKVRISPEGLKDAEGALTRSDVKGLIDKGIVTKAKPSGRASTRRRGRIGHGRRRGTPLDRKQVWMEKIRAQRRFLFMLLSEGALKKEAKRALYRKIKSGIFRNKRAMLLYLKENQLVAADYEPKKPEFRKPEPKPKKEKPLKAEEKKTGAKAPEAKKAAQKPESGTKQTEAAKSGQKAEDKHEHAGEHAHAGHTHAGHAHASSGHEAHPKEKGEHR